MAYSDWATNNMEGKTVGPIFVPDGMEISGVELKEQAGFGVTDLRFHFRLHSGDTTKLKRTNVFSGQYNTAYCSIF